MATELKGQLYSTQENTKYEVFLDNLTPDSGGEDIDIVDLSYSYKFDEKDVDSHLLLSNVKVVFRVTTTAQEDVLEDMSEAAETVYRIRILRDGVLDFVGFVLTDLLSIDDTSGDYNYTVTATDGVARLKTIEYDGGGTYYDDYLTVSGHIDVILSKIPLSTYYAATEEYYRINSTMWPDGLTPADATDQMKLLRCSYRAFRTIDRQGQPIFSSVYDVLLEFCRAFGLRFMYSRGRYVFAETVDYTRSSGNITWIRYDQAGTRLSDDVLTGWGDWRRTVGNTADYLDATNPGVTLRGGKITYLPPLSKVKWVYKHYSKQSTLPTTSTWTNLSNPAVTIQNFVTATGLSLRISALARLSVTPPPGESFTVEPVHVVIGMTLFVDGDSTDKILTRTYNVTPSGTVSYGTESWEDGLSGSYGTAMRVTQLQDTIRQINIITPEVPNSGTLSLQFSVLAILKSGSPWASASAEYEVYDPYMETAINGSVSGQYNFSTFGATNSAFSTNSAMLEKEVLLGDGPTENSFGRFELDNGTTWEKTDGWRRYAAGGYIDGTSLTHGAIRAKNVLALQDANRFVLDSTLAIRDYAPEYMIYRSGRSYLMRSGTFDATADRWKGKWQEISYFPGNVTSPTEVQGDTNPITGPGDGGGEPIVTPYVPPVNPSTGNIGDNNGVAAINTVPTETGEDIDTGVNIGNLTVNNLDDVPLYAGDIITLTNPLTGETQNFTVAYDSDLGVPDADQITPGGTSIPYYGPDGLVWLVPDTGTVAIEDELTTSDFPSGSYIQPEPQFTAQLQALLRKEHYDFHLFDYDTSITTGFVGPFWRAGNRIGWGIRKVHFAFAQDEGATAVKVNLKYYDATGFRYTVATYNSDGLGGVVDAYADVAEGYYRVQVETITGTAPKGLTVSVQMIKNN